MINAYMNKTTLVLLATLHGCTVDLSVTQPIPVTQGDTFWLGDSLCDPTFPGNTSYVSPQWAGIPFNCLTSRRLVDIHPEDLYAKNKFNKVVINLGTNDASEAHNPKLLKAYGERLDEFLNYDDAEYTCVLPNIIGSDREDAIRATLQTKCSNTVDPRILGVEVSWDGVHTTPAGQITLGNYFKL